MVLTRTLLTKKIYILNLLEYQKIGILLELNKSKCEIDKFFLEQEKIKINNIQDKINIGNITDSEINILINNFNKFYNK